MSGHTPSCVVVAGQIACGKTTLAEHLAADCGYRHVRVREALLVVLGGTDWDRRRLQVEGADLDRRTAGRWLLEYLAESLVAGERLVVDSGRTRRQVEPILLALDAVLIYLDAAEVVREQRYAVASATDPVKRGVPFREAMDHDTEREARTLRAMSHLVIDTDGLVAGGVATEAASFLGCGAPGDLRGDLPGIGP